VECSQNTYDKDGTKTTRRGVVMPPGMVLSCGWCRTVGGEWKKVKDFSLCPKGAPVNGKSLSTKNWQAFRYYLEIKAGAPMPDDRTVRRNCALIRWAEDTYERGQAMLVPLALGLLRGK